MGNKSLFKDWVILDRMNKADDEVGVRELARSPGIPTSVVNRLVGALNHSGYIEPDPGSYRIGNGGLFSPESREH